MMLLEKNWDKLCVFRNASTDPKTGIKTPPFSCIQVLGESICKCIKETCPIPNGFTAQSQRILTEWKIKIEQGIYIVEGTETAKQRQQIELREEYNALSVRFCTLKDEIAMFRTKNHFIAVEEEI